MWCKKVELSKYWVRSLEELFESLLYFKNQPVSLYPSHKSEKFSQILKFRWLSLEHFWGISQGSCDWFQGNSRVFLQNWFPISEIFWGSDFWDLVSSNSLDFFPRNSQKFLRNISLEIPGAIFLDISKDFPLDCYPWVSYRGCTNIWNKKEL